MEKLKSSDLMTGNYLQKDGVIHQVTAIVDNQNNKKYKASDIIKTDKTSEYVFLDHFEPILITTKILTKLSFNKAIKGYSHDEVSEYSISQISGCFYISESNEITECSHIISEVKYLHDLQNIYKINRKFVLKLKK